jgi:hypothetical protein
VAVEQGRLDPQAARLELKKSLSGGRGAEKSPVEAARRPVAPQRPLLPAEKWLLAMLLREAPDAAEVLDELEEGDLQDLGSAEILRAARGLRDRGLRVNAAGLQDAVEGEAARRLVTELAVTAAPTGNATPLGCVYEIKCRLMEQRIASVKAALSRTADDAEQTRLLRQQEELKRRVKDLMRSQTVS